MRKFSVLCVAAGLMGSAAVLVPTYAANNTDDGFIWIDANTRIKVKPVAVKPAPDAAAGATAPEKAPKKDEKKETPKK